jgi:uncharacterized membrane protein
MSGRRTGRADERYRTDGGREPDALTDLDGIGPARADRLRDAGFESVAALRDASRADLVDVLGPELADQVLGQFPSGGAPDEGTAASDPGPSVPDDSGPSVPTSSGPENAAGAGAGESSGTPVRESGGQSGQAGGGRAAGNTGTQGTGGAGTVQTASAQSGAQATNDSDEDAILAGLLSFLIPGVGNMINGQTSRGLIILILWVLWLVVGWGVGVFLIGGIIGVLTLGIGFLLIGAVVGLMEFLIHVLAAVDAYRGSKVVDNVTGKVNQVRGD